ncbi:hypothetical protein B0A50_03825 [Salinomyces thailandicus]|uniref:GRIP domain-containing protein n=1 Tax=Salinomyces thailandicus TaxID=706561 RepID=A0A4U0U0N5_9PEZI|nr:hypothetical protein B0A50_03825 [Salinomyces thailandica]
MFQRLKGFNLDSFLDSKIAEEQARQGQNGSPSRSPVRRQPSNAGGGRGSGRTNSPARRAGGRLKVAEAEGAGPAGKGPDPEEFVIGDDVSEISRAATPRPVKESAEDPLGVAGEQGKQDAGPAMDKGKEKADNDELPDDVRKKLAKLEHLATKYQDLLRNYRTAHARVSAIEPFEATLREHTPLTSIAEPGALVEFLNQRSLQSDMVLEELKRITGENKDVVKERDELKTKLDEAERKAKEAFDEAAGLREQREQRESKTPETQGSSLDSLSNQGVGTDAKDGKGKEDGNEFFSFDSEQQKNREEELKQLEAEIESQKEYINELSTENATLRNDFSTCELDLDAMRNKVGVKEREIEGMQSSLTEVKKQLSDAAQTREDAKQQEQEAAASLAQTEGHIADLQEKLKGYRQSLQQRERQLQDKAEQAEENLKKYQREHEENLKKGKYVKREGKEMETLRNLVSTLREQLKKAEEAKKQAESNIENFRLELNRLESEAGNSANIISTLRGHEAAAESLKSRLAEVERERDNAQSVAVSKKGHESAVASLRSQLKRAEKDRDGAYQLVLDCGRCAPPAKPNEAPTATSTPQTRSRQGSEATAQTESTQATEVSTPAANGELETSEAKKKNKKKKSKAKKKATDAAAGGDEPSSAQPQLVHSTSVSELIESPEKAQAILDKGDQGDMFKILIEYAKNARQGGETHEDEQADVIRHHEDTIMERDQTIRENVRLFREKEEECTALKHSIGEKEKQIERLEGKLKDQEGLEEDIEQLKDEVTELGQQATDAKHELKLVKEQKEKLQDGFDDLQREGDSGRKGLKDAEAQRDDLAQRCKTLETEIVELKNLQSTSSTTSAEDLQVVKEQLKNVGKEKESLQLAKDASEKQIVELKAQNSASDAAHDTKHKSLSGNFEELKARATALEKDLAAANQLSQTRFKDLTDLREHLNKVQPELKKLREESNEFKTVKSELEKSNSTAKRLEAKEKDLRSEIAEYKSQGSAKDGEIVKLKDSAKKSDQRSSALEESYENARKDLEQSQSMRDEAIETCDKLQADLKKAEAELKTSATKAGDLEKQIGKLREEANGLRSDLQAKSSLQASAQSQMDSQQEQSRELATQMKEIRERNESLEEELADAHRLLSERGREGETIRRMLNDVEARAEGRVQEMRERLDLAVEERDRAEDEASSIGRRKTRELEDLKTRLKDAEREAARATESREDAERRERQFKSRQDDLERRASQAQEELSEVRSAMAQLQSTLDETERQSRDLDKEKADLRRMLEEREARLEKLQKSSRAMADELRTLQSANKLQQSSIQSSRSSLDSSKVASPRVTSPAPKGNGAPVATTGGAHAKESIDYVYLKNVLLQFLEQREKKHQLQLVPVLGMLLHFDRQDQQKWEAAIAAK